MKSMGCVLMAPLVNEVVKKGKSFDHSQVAITHLTRVRTNDPCSVHNETCFLLYQFNFCSFV